MNTEHLEANWDVAIVGGGSAGLSAALTLARARRSVLVIDSGTPRNAPAAAVHGLLGHESINPSQLLAKGRAEASSYGAKIVDAVVGEASGIAEEGFILRLDNGTTQRAGQVLVATGVRDDLPAIPGLADRWGRDVVHCPYCHGWEIRDQRIGLIATGPMSAMQAILFHQWSADLCFFLNDIEIPTEQLDKLRALNVRVVPGSVQGIEVTNDQLTGALLHDGTSVPLDALAVPTQIHARLDGLTGLALGTTENAMGVSVHVDEAGRTSVPGVWAAGNVMGPWMQVSEAVANGARVAMTINTELALAHAGHAMTTPSTTTGS
ncbi:MAG: NAD(P)/FAD-dependent oxidoreductase [Yaniella sp.]|uniref:NAD(P)/FAD-dependent oxidoreductase n=1 Tax=Yaniella sp. TaxID=2773929 RepID=UPI002647C210|nr:NAD(P)/FAD-dependent oxidoreductase [Yaniella sp.]MDN5815935.1 NAD(P)/FAD-dependent oxidoreductase [Yaniella sp.]MDN5913360.1 NAD(P)/FAD-dependent oxidoreductase [Yaniella sp.]MDN6152312.1 NAD(P)/FAD-dependent oxidoreductase [Yaniella sp.]MDN6757715.1 NAD(P)/FAD-dependent oxidoreductase [Yaniella sp.]